MPGKRLRDPSLVRTTFTEAISNGAEILTDWIGLVEARPLSLALVGNAYFQGSDDGIIYSDTVSDSNTHLRVSTDGGTTWSVIDLSGGGTDHPELTLGVPTGGLALDVPNQVLTLENASITESGAMSSSDKIKLDALKFDELANVGAGEGLYKNAVTVGQITTHNIKSLIPGTNVTLTPGTDSITIDFSGTGGGEVNTASNIGTHGVGVWDQKVGVDLQFRHIASTNTLLTVALDAVDNDIDLTVNESLIDHDALTNSVPNEHIDHSTVSILTQEGITGGGNLTATRTLTLSFDTLTPKTIPDDTDLFAFYRNVGGENEHYSITYSDLVDGVTEVHNTYYVPLATIVEAGPGLGGGGSLATNIEVHIDWLELPPSDGADPTDVIAIYDQSLGAYTQIAIGSISGTVTSVAAGAGMDFTTITGTGSVIMGTPSTVDQTSTNLVTGTTHEHELVIDNLTYIGDVPTPTASFYLRRNALDTGYEWADPALGATTPGAPANSIQFNNAGAFGGNAGLLYYPTTDIIYFDDPNASAGKTLVFGSVATDPNIYVNNAGTITTLSTTGVVNSKFLIDSPQIGLGDNGITSLPDTFLSIKDENLISPFTEIVRVVNTADADLLVLNQDGNFYLPRLATATASDILYFDSTTGLVTYGAPPSGSGGIQTLIADSASGLMVNGASSSSASTIELDQNDLKLTARTPVATDWIGFYDVSAGAQSRMQLSDFPGWNLYVNDILQEEVSPGGFLDIKEGTGIVLGYNPTLNELTISSSGSGGCTQLVADLGTLSTGTANLDLDTYAGAIIELTSGGTITISMDNLQEGDTGHIEVTHAGAERLLFSSAVASAIIIANNSRAGANEVLLTNAAAVDTVCFWYAKGNLHLAVIYDLS